MANEKFSIGDAIKYGWETFKANAGFLIGFVVVIGLITLIPDVLADKIFQRGTVGYIIAKLITRLIGLLLGMVATRVSLDIHDKGAADTGNLGGLTNLIPGYVVGKILYGIMVVIGMILLIVPGIIVAYMFLYVGYLIVDRGLGPIEALKESKVITDGVKWDLFLFSLLVALINLVGVVCLIVGLVVTIPVTLMASAYVYRRLSPAPESAETA